MRVVLLLSLLSVSACTSEPFTHPSPVCTTVLEYDLGEICQIGTNREWCAILPVGEPHPVTVCR